MDKQNELIDTDKTTAASSSLPKSGRAYYAQGLSDGLPIGLGYLTISSAFGIYAVAGGLTPLTAILISLTNLTSSGQFAGVAVIKENGLYLELALTVLLVNLRYILMSLYLSQKLPPNYGTFKRAVMGFGVTDEIFAMAIRQSEVRFPYFLGLMTTPILGWSAGTAIGAFLGELLPISLQSAFGILLYAMFIAIVVPPAGEQKNIRSVVLVAAVLSTALAFTPFLRELAAGWRIIISTLIAATIGAFFFPLESEDVV